MDAHVDDEEPPLLLELENEQLDSDLPGLVDTSTPEAEAGPSRPRSGSPLSAAKYGSTSGNDAFDRPKVPITLLTGYLGAGKSTLLEYVLTAQHGYRIAVCMNARSLTLSDPKSSEATTTSFLSLPNGCLCCSVKDLGIAAIEDMVASAPGGVDWVMVELTGVADPGPIVRTFWSNEEMGDLVLDGVVCVVDSRNVLKQLAEERPEGEINECQKQVACADVILLNKIDLVSPEQLSHVEKTIRTINPTLRLHHTDHSRAPLNEMFNIRAFTDSAGSALRDIDSSIPSSSSSQLHRHDHGHEHEHGAECTCEHSHSEDNEAITSHHHSRISTVLIPLPPLSTEQYQLVNAFLETLLWEGRYPPRADQSEKGDSAPEILRTKGYITLEDGQAYVLQGVVDIFELKSVERGGPRDDKEAGGKVVFIGKDVGDDLVIRLKEYLKL